MLKSRAKALFLEISDYSVLAARATALEPPFVLEELREAPLGSADDLAALVGEMIPLPKGQYVPAVVGVYPQNRFVRRATLEAPAKAKDPGYLAEFVQQQFQVDPARNVIAVLNADAGISVSAETGFPKELLFCGAPLDELQERQTWVVSAGVYPERLEIGSVATLGGLMSCLVAEDVKSPTLLLEILPENSQVFIFHGNVLDVARPIAFGLNSMFPVVQMELGLKDIESARKLFFSNTFDFTEMGPALMKKMLKELQASTGFYEVQTGQTIGQIHLSLIPKNLSWMSSALARSLGVDQIKLEYGRWLKSLGIEPAPGVELAALDSRWLGLFSLMGKYEPKTESKTEAAASAHA
ncbi:MAG: hypothetical protein ABSH19_00355 [Opitutales bacterium]|jgi:hypothetical protein